MTKHDTEHSILVALIMLFSPASARTMMRRRNSSGMMFLLPIIISCKGIKRKLFENLTLVMRKGTISTTLYTGNFSRIILTFFMR